MNQLEGDMMNIALWIVQGLLAALFLFAGGVKLVMPIEEMMRQMPLPTLAAGDVASELIPLGCGASLGVRCLWPLALGGQPHGIACIYQAQGLNSFPAAG